MSERPNCPICGRDDRVVGLAPGGVHGTWYCRRPSCRKVNRGEGFAEYVTDASELARLRAEVERLRAERDALVEACIWENTRDGACLVICRALVRGYDSRAEAVAALREAVGLGAREGNPDAR